MIGVAPYDKNHTEYIDSRKIGITCCFFVLNMSGYITNCRIEFFFNIYFLSGRKWRPFSTTTASKSDRMSFGFRFVFFQEKHR